LFSFADRGGNPDLFPGKSRRWEVKKAVAPHWKEQEKCEAIRQIHTERGRQRQIISRSKTFSDSNNTYAYYFFVPVVIRFLILEIN
jgi:hypothetical protein